MPLSDSLINKFAKMVKPEAPKKREKTFYGTIVEQDGSKYVRLDGSSLLTPITTTVDSSSGERVTVMIKNHTAIVTGNITSPSVRSVTVANAVKDINTSFSKELENKANTNDIVDMIYPVGSIYLSVNDVDPTALFGGKWERIKDRFLLASGGSYSTGATGGEANHALTEDELPKVEGTFSLRPYGGNAGLITSSSGAFTHALGEQTVGSVATNTSTTASERTVKMSIGGGQAHNNMPPYLAINVWKRIE